MINLTKLNDNSVTINPELIEIMQETPDTNLTLTTGRKLIVKESIEEIVDKIIKYKKELLK